MTGRCRRHHPAQIFAAGLVLPSFIAAATAVGALPAVSDAEPPPTKRREFVAVDRAYAERAHQLAGNRPTDLDTLLSVMCATALQKTAAADGRPLEDEIRAVFGGLWIWSRNQGQPRFQHRHDLALHFIGGGAFQGYWDAGTSAALVKERADARGPGGRYDLDDLAATMLGARWIELATTGTADQNRAWIERWARRRSTLATAIQPLRFGQRSADTVSPEEIATVWRQVNTMLSRPD